MTKWQTFFLFLSVVFSQSPACAYDAVKFDAAGNYSWTVPLGVTRIYVTAAGAGGGGGGGGLNYDMPEQIQEGLMRVGGGGGGGASFVKEIFDVSPGQILRISCGKGGAGGRQGMKSRIAGEGGDGGNTYAEGLFSLNGGKGAKFPPNYPHPHSPAPGGLPGGKGGQRGGYGAWGAGRSLENSGAGGGTLIGFGGQPGNVFSLNGDDGCYGGGGGGGSARADSNTFGSGGAGGDGVVIIEWEACSSVLYYFSASVGNQAIYQTFFFVYFE